MCFDFFAQILSETFLSLRGTERDMIKYIGLHMKYPLLLSDLKPFNAERLKNTSRSEPFKN
jgi:hypothetical protein